MNDQMKLARLEHKRAERAELLSLLQNPVIEIILGYVVIEALQNLGYTKETLTIRDMLTGNVTVRPLRPIIPPAAGSVAEAGLLVAVALQQPGGLDLLKTAIAAGGEGLKMLGRLVPGALSALK